MINFILLVSRQGKTRLAKWFVQMAAKDKVIIIIITFTIIILSLL